MKNGNCLGYLHFYYCLWVMCTFFQSWSMLLVWFLIWSTNISFIQFTTYISNKPIMLLQKNQKQTLHHPAQYFPCRLFSFPACLLSDFNNFSSFIRGKNVSKICHVLWVCTKSTIIQYIWYTLTVMLEWMLIEFILKVHVRDIYSLTIYYTLKMKSGDVATYFRSHWWLKKQICKFEYKSEVRSLRMQSGYVAYVCIHLIFDRSKKKFHIIHFMLWWLQSQQTCNTRMWQKKMQYCDSPTQTSTIAWCTKRYRWLLHEKQRNSEERED